MFLAKQPEPLIRWIDEHSPRLYRSAARLASVEEAEDLCQDVFLVAADRWGGFEGRSQPYTWLHGILRNLIRDRRRKQATRARRVAPQLQVMEADTPERQLHRAQDRQRVREAIAGLPEPQREVIARFYVEDRSIAEIAAALGLPEGTIKSRLFNGRRALRRALEGAR